MQTIARLHNFCLTENNDYDEMAQGTPHEMDQGATPQPVARLLEIGLQTNGEQPTPTAGVSYLREALVKRVKDAGLSRVNISN